MARNIYIQLCSCYNRYTDLIVALKIISRLNNVTGESLLKMINNHELLAEEIRIKITNVPDFERRYNKVYNCTCKHKVNTKGSGEPNKYNPHVRSRND